MRTISPITITLGAALILLLLSIAMMVSGEMNWSLSDFAIAWVLLTGAGFAYRFARKQTGNGAYRIAAGIAVVTTLLLIWGNLAVGLIGNEDNPANTLYFAVPAVGLLGAILARLKPRGMMRVLGLMALTQLLVPIVAMIIWRPTLTFEVVQVIGVSTFFAVLFVASALLFRQAGQGLETKAT